MITFIEIAKSSALCLLISGFLFFVHAAEVQARKLKTSDAAKILPPGGKSIGGPGYWDGRLTIWGQYQVR